MQLGLAVAIADTVTKAARSGYEFDPDSKARQLRGKYPEAHVSHDEIVEVLRAEKAASSPEVRGRMPANA